MRRESAFAGLGLGLLAGALVGLSTAPLVVSVVSAIMALLAGFFAFGQKLEGPALWRVAGFGFGGVVGLALGLVVRVQDLANASPAREVGRLTAAGFTPDRAREIFQLSRYGQTPAPQAARASGLFAGEADLCGRIQLLPPAEVAIALGRTEAPGPRFRVAARLLAEGRISGDEARSLLCEN